MHSDSCVYTKGSLKNGTFQCLVVFVDDFIVMSSNEYLLAGAKAMLKREYQMHDLGPVPHYVGFDWHFVYFLANLYH